jgi:Pvc16 N-terminal domain
MIDLVLGFLQNRLGQALPRAPHGEPQEKLFVYVGTDKNDAASFKSDAISTLLVRIEEETALRPPDRYARTAGDGLRQRVEPEIHMNLWVMFVARFADYGEGLRHLSRVVAYFQGHRLFNQENSPDLNEDLQQVVVELVTPTFSEQNNIWGSLRSAYLPSALYRVKLVVFRDQEARSLVATQELIQSVSQAPAR